MVDHGLGLVRPVRYNGRIYWTADEPNADVFREDGTLETAFRFKFSVGEDGETRANCVLMPDIS